MRLVENGSDLWLERLYSDKHCDYIRVIAEGSFSDSANFDYIGIRAIRCEGVNTANIDEVKYILKQAEDSLVGFFPFNVEYCYLSKANKKFNGILWKSNKNIC